MIRIATLYGRPFDLAAPTSMSEIRWLRMAAALARRGYAVDLIAAPGSRGRPRAENGAELRTVALPDARWHDYDVVKFSYQRGHQLLRSVGADEHPFVICRLGAVVDKEDRDDIPFTGREREVLYAIQERLSGRVRCVAVLTEAERILWQRLFGLQCQVLRVPTGVDGQLSPPGRSPYRAFGERIALHAGNLRGAVRRYAEPGGAALALRSQREMNLRWQARLNRIGRMLRAHGIRLCCIGPGRSDRLDPEAVTYLGAVPNAAVWDYHTHADVGLALAQGPEQLQECSKLYYYLRAGLPTVSEAPIPNNDLIAETGLGSIAAFEDDEAIVSLLRAETGRHATHRDKAMRSMRANHSWDRRAAIYDDFIRREIDASP